MGFISPPGLQRLTRLDQSYNNKMVFLKQSNTELQNVIRKLESWELVGCWYDWHICNSFWQGCNTLYCIMYTILLYSLSSLYILFYTMLVLTLCFPWCTQSLYSTWCTHPLYSTWCTWCTLACTCTVCWVWGLGWWRSSSCAPRPVC